MQKLLDGFGLLEGPVWTDRGLVFADASAGGLWGWEGGPSARLVLPYRKGMAGVVEHQDGGFVVSGRNLAHKTIDRTTVLFEQVEGGPRRSFNDLTTDSVGRVYFGSVAGPLGEAGLEGPAELCLLDLDGSVRVLADDVLLSNGLAFSGDGRHLYHADSLRKMVWRYQVSTDGNVGSRTAFWEVGNAGASIPDGLAVAADGSVWIAVAHGGHVLVVEPDGRVRTHIPVPAPMVTSLCFGGEDGRDVFITTGPDAQSGSTGAVFVERAPAPGVTVHPARVPLPAT